MDNFPFPWTQFTDVPCLYFDSVYGGCGGALLDLMENCDNYFSYTVELKTNDFTLTHIFIYPIHITK